ncbi:MAG: PepSY-associated TM helix domain-containing protein, partial [Pseudomonadota bacterium]
MDRVRHKRIYDLHSWAGVVSSFLLYIVCFSGTAAVPLETLASWEDPSLRIAVAAEPATVHDKIENWVNTLAGDGEVENVTITLPNPSQPAWEVYLTVHQTDDSHVQYHTRLDSKTGEPITHAERGDGLIHWLRFFHHYLMWPDFLGGGHPVGAILVGIAGVVLALITVSGIVAHRKFLKEMFTLR